MLTRNKKGQAVIIDLFIALSILTIVFITVILLFNFYSIRLQKEVFREELRDKAFVLTELLLSQGKPVDWDSSNVEIIGLTRYDRHITKERFDELKNNIPYTDAKSLFGLGGIDFYLRLIEVDGVFIGEYGNDEDLSGKEVIALRRIVFYENVATKMEIRVWRI